MSLLYFPTSPSKSCHFWCPCADLGKELEKIMVFVFGSNFTGRHGAGAAKEAVRYHGAIYGQGVGRQGDAYAIPTKDAAFLALPLWRIKPFVDDFLNYARAHPDLIFSITRIGCGLAGYKDEDVAPMFADAPVNCALPFAWARLLASRS